MQLTQTLGQCGLKRHRPQAPRIVVTLIGGIQAQRALAKRQIIGPTAWRIMYPTPQMLKKFRKRHVLGMF